MANERKNEAQTDIDLFNFLSNKRSFTKKWVAQKSKNKHISSCLSKASKSGKGNQGNPDLIYLNTNKKLLIIIENKDSIKDHISKKKPNAQKFAVDGIKHYLSFFVNDKLSSQDAPTQKFISSYRIIGIAFSGDISDTNNHRVNTHIIEDNIIVDIDCGDFLNEDDYTALFENLDVEKLTNEISKSSSKVNRILRNIDSQKRPVLLSALMVCLYESEDASNDFKDNYSNWSKKNIIRNIPTTINDILYEEGIDQSKIDILTNELAFIKTDTDLNNTDILKEILEELEINVIPLFKTKTSYDIIGKFYEEFLRYAGVSNVKKGIVLTPNHITSLFTELIDFKTNDIIFDACCGTGAFLIAGMNKLIDIIKNSKEAKKEQRISAIKQKQLLGFEKSNTMYSLAVSNMLFRGNGKSKLHNIDFFSEDALKILEKTKPTIGFINPPYGGRDNKSNPTKKEIQFLERMLDNVSRYGVIIAPLSTYFKDEVVRNRILSKHTLKYVINMPGELFQPNASTHTSIAVFETHSPHNDKKVVLTSISDDGFVLSKNKGRTDVYNKWPNIKNELLNKLYKPSKYKDDNYVVNQNIYENDEWILQAHMKTDYSQLCDNDFVKSIKQYTVFSFKLESNLLDKDIDDITLLELLNQNNISAQSYLENGEEE